MKTSTNLRPSLPPTNRLAQQMRQHPLVFFYLIAFGWSWAVDLLFLGLFRQPAGSVAEALLMTALTEGRAGIAACCVAVCSGVLACAGTYLSSLVFLLSSCLAFSSRQARLLLCGNRFLSCYSVTSQPSW